MGTKEDRYLPKDQGTIATSPSLLLLLLPSSSSTPPPPPPPNPPPPLFRRAISGLIASGTGAHGRFQAIDPSDYFGRRPGTGGARARGVEGGKDFDLRGVMREVGVEENIETRIGYELSDFSEPEYDIGRRREEERGRRRGGRNERGIERDGKRASGGREGRGDEECGGQEGGGRRMEAVSCGCRSRRFESKGRPSGYLQGGAGEEEGASSNLPTCLRARWRLRGMELSSHMAGGVPCNLLAEILKSDVKTHAKIKSFFGRHDLDFSSKLHAVGKGRGRRRGGRKRRWGGRNGGQMGSQDGWVEGDLERKGWRDSKDHEEIDEGRRGKGWKSRLKGREGWRGGAEIFLKMVFEALPWLAVISLPPALVFLLLVSYSHAQGLQRNGPGGEEEAGSRRRCLLFLLHLAASEQYSLRRRRRRRREQKKREFDCRTMIPGKSCPMKRVMCYD
eukprot:504501-Hanusia_phi.AAC.1